MSANAGQARVNRGPPRVVGAAQGQSARRQAPGQDPDGR